jgi:Xaa-Pro dipeptidase
MPRLQRLQQALDRGQALLVTSPINIRYLAGLMIHPAERFYALLVTPEQAVLFVPELEQTAARTFHGQIVPVSDAEDLAALLAAHKPAGSLAVEKRHLTVERLELVQAAWKLPSVSDCSARLEGLRLIKDDDELSVIRRACRVIDEVVPWAYEQLREGMTERDLVSLIDQRLAQHYSVRPAFPSAAQFGKNSAQPHGSPGSYKLAAGDAVLLDIGAQVEGYPSDITRTAFWGPASAQMKRVYGVVLEAHLAASAKLGPGVVVGEVDKAAREVIERAGFGDKFSHRVGHGLGLEVHEAPSMHGHNTTTLQPGMVVTVEPGIYLPGEGGVRIEDDYLITDQGAERMTTADRHLIELPTAR